MLAELAAMASEISVGVAAAHSDFEVRSTDGQTGTVIAEILPPVMVATT